MHKFLAVEPANYYTYSYHRPFHGEPLLQMMIDERRTKLMFFEGFCIYLLLNGFMVFSSILFRKYMVFKMALLATVIITLSVFILYIILESVDVHESHLEAYAKYIFGPSDEYGYWSRTAAFFKLIFSVLGISGIVFWIATYMQLTEREVK
jgi:hypothetical protein